jgi:hypothetical protein
MRTITLVSCAALIAAACGDSGSAPPAASPDTTGPLFPDAAFPDLVETSDTGAQELPPSAPETWIPDAAPQEDALDPDAASPREIVEPDAVTADSAPADTGPQRLCEPGIRIACYEGPAGTERLGTCRGGRSTCAPDGLSWGPCEGQVLPVEEGCAFSCDEDCDGRVRICPAGERCNLSTNACETDPDLDVVIAPEFAPYYRVFDLGSPPGVPGPLGGCILRRGDRNTLLLAGNSESADGELHAVSLTRNACGHITGFSGTSTKVAQTPNIDANLVYASADLLLYSMWPSNKIGQVVFDASSGGATVGPALSLSTLGVPSSVGGLGLVPQGLAAAGQLRAITWSGGAWHRLGFGTDPSDSRLLAAPTATRVSASTLPNGPGGFAYVPAGSPGFTTQSLIVSEWSNSSVAVYDVDGQGDPNPSTRRAFFTAIPRPWGAYFEAETGDFLFLDWRSGSTRVYIVQGFMRPPPPPPIVKN